MSIGTATVSDQYEEGVNPSCQKAIDELFDTHGPAAILYALAVRCKGEAGIAAGEDKGRERQWSQLATDIELIETPISVG